MDKKVKILIIANKIVFPTSDGGSVAMANLCNMLGDQKYMIDLISISKNNNINTINKPIESKQNLYVNQIIFQKNMRFNIFNFINSILQKKSYQASRFYHKKIHRFIQNKIKKKKYEIIIFESIFTTVYLSNLEIPPSTTKILRAHNIEHKIWRDLANQKKFKKIPFLLLSYQLRIMEENTPKKLDYILTLSKKDETYFKNIFPKKTYNIPVTFKPKSNNIPKIKNSIFHLGAMDWKPNKEGLNWFLKEVKPLIEIKKNIKIYIAGKNMPSSYMKYKNKNTIINSRIDNAQSYINNKEILFVPLLSGSGIRIKILEAMSIGTPVVSTTQGADGIPYTHNENILIADNPSDFANAIHKLIENKSWARQIGENGKNLIKQNFSKKSIIEKWKKINP